MSTITIKDITSRDIHEVSENTICLEFWGRVRNDMQTAIELDEMPQVGEQIETSQGEARVVLLSECSNDYPFFVLDKNMGVFWRSEIVEE